MTKLRLVHVSPEYINDTVSNKIQKIIERLAFLEELEESIKETALLVERYKRENA